MNHDSKHEGDGVTVSVDGRAVDVTTGDGVGMRGALMRYLEARTPKEIEDRDWLMRATAQAQPSLDEGTLRLGAWLLDAAAGTLRYRMPSNGDGRRFYVATLTRSGGRWEVRSIDTEHVLPRQ